ncbi:dihydrodipicolinate synthase family protein [Streptomyces sp. NPDC087440]|uniref:dihydrodipicolinate synthase family protein n=1 Tax=Streptomyces sp. NPDC087440 TaxID=3365790 RepID=UPI00382872B0
MHTGDLVRLASPPSSKCPSTPTDRKLDLVERELLTTLLLECTRRRTDVAAVVSVPDHATRHAVAQALRAAELGADALNLLPPHFLGPSRDAVPAHVRAVLTAMDPLPVVVQYAPAQTGTALDAATLHLLAAGERPLPAFVGYAGAARSGCSRGARSPSCTSSCGAGGRRATRPVRWPCTPGWFRISRTGCRAWS